MASSRKKVMLVSPSLSDGGAERVMIYVGQGLAEMGYDVDFVIKNDISKNRYEVPDSIKPVNLDAGGLVDTTRKLAKRYGEVKPDVVISAMQTLGLASIVARMLSRHKPAVVPSVHNSLATYFKRNPSRHNQRYKAMMKLLYPIADRIVAVSQGVKDEFRSFVKVPDEKVAVLYNPAVSKGILASINAPCSHPWFDTDRFMAVAVGRLVPQKNYPLMLKAVAEARKKINLHLIVLGDGDLRESLIEEAKALGIAEYVDFHGFASNPAAYVAQANVFLMSSDWEGLGNVLIEALTTGTPVISTDCPSGPREILESGRWGILVPPNDVDLLVEAILQVANGGGIVPTADSWERFTVENATRGYARLIDELP